jgi:cytolysin-activating lysine-acyltransferase
MKKSKSQKKPGVSSNRDRESEPSKARTGQDTPASAQAEGTGAASQFAGKTVASVFGEIVWLLSRSPKHRHRTLADLEWLVMPPLLLRQFKLYYAGKQPVAVELFAKVSPEVARRLDAGDEKLAPQEWRSGDITRVVHKIELTAGTRDMSPPKAGQ